jgi:HEPN domain-containing protein
VDEDTLQRNLEGKFDDISVHVQLIAEDIELVNSNIEEGQFFFSDIKREGKILYTSGRHGLAKPQEISPVRRRELAEEDFEYWFKKATNFCILHQEARRRQFAGEAAFLVQQAVEMCYTAVEMVFAHYNAHEHDLGILRSRAAEFDRRMDGAFLRETREQSELFNHLNYAYIGGRYRTEEEFPVTGEQLDYWAREAKKLLDITETVCLERIEELKKIERRG